MNLLLRHILKVCNLVRIKLSLKCNSDLCSYYLGKLFIRKSKVKFFAVKFFCCIQTTALNCSSYRRLLSAVYINGYKNIIYLICEINSCCALGHIEVYGICKYLVLVIKYPVYITVYMLLRHGRRCYKNLVGCLTVAVDIYDSLVGDVGCLTVLRKKLCIRYAILDFSLKCKLDLLTCEISCILDGGCDLLSVDHRCHTVY